MNVDEVRCVKFRAHSFSTLHRLEIHRDRDRPVRASGVSVWSGGLTLPWQRPDARLRETERFFEAAGVLAAYEAPKAS